MSQTEITERILIVDDIPTNLRLLSQILQDRGFDVRAVTNGARAIASIEADPPDLVLLDIRMPGMDGYEVCRRMKENIHSKDIPVLFISSLDDIDDKMQAFSAGGVDYITKPFQIEEVVARVETHLSLRRLQTNLEEANQRMQRELTLAGQVQSSMMIRQLPEIPGWQLAVKLIPAKLTCGDFFDVFTLADGRLGILIADVVDKGVGAALYMAMCFSLLRTYLQEFPDNPTHIFESANRRMLEDIDTDQFLTAFLGILNPANGEMIYANAGHNPPLLFRNQNPNSHELLNRTGTVLGILDDQRWDQAKVIMRPGDAVVFYTDGIPDAENSLHNFYGMERFTRIVKKNSDRPAQEIRDSIISDLHNFVQGAEQSDDIALIILTHLQ
jgi:sigma-B regulation protein RsbU (phosphoserine phosphatase)